MCVLPVEPMCHTYMIYSSPFLWSCLLSPLWILVSQLAVPLWLFIVRYYLSFIQVHIFLKGMTFEKLKTQGCYFCNIFKDTLQTFTALWLEIKQLILLGHLWYRGRICSLVSFLFSCIPSTCTCSARVLWCAYFHRNKRHDLFVWTKWTSTNAH